MEKRFGVLFVQAQSGVFASTMVHSLIMRYLDRGCIEVHLACSSARGGEKTPALRVLETIPDVHIRLTRFGPTIFRQATLDIAKNALFAGPATFVSLIGLARYIKRHQIAIIHTGDRPRDALYSALLAKTTGARCVVHVHAKCASWFGSRVFWAMRQASAIIGVSEFVRQSLIAHGYAPRLVHTVHNALMISEWDYTLNGSAIRQGFGIAPDTPLLALIGRAVPSKGHEQLLRALALVKTQVRNVKALIVGEDDFHVLQDGHSFTGELKRLAKELELEENVIFCGPRSDVQAILAACDIFTLPALEEGFCLAFAEAMAMKKPVVAVQSGAAPEVVEHGKAGLLSSPGDTRQLAENILMLINSPARREQMGAQGRERVEKYFNAQRLATDVERVYHVALSSRG